MIKDFLADILIDPGTKLPLILHDNKTLSDENHSTEYHIDQNVPVILVPGKKISTELPFFTDHKSDFDYRAHYNNDAEFFDYFKYEESIATRTERTRSRQAIISRVPASATDILDVGCGGAWVAQYFTGKGKNVVSMDISTRNPVEALKKFPSDHHAGVVADVFNLPFKKNSFDLIIASEVIEHVYDPKQFIQILVDALKDNGRLVLMTPYNEKIVYNVCVHCNRPTPANAHLHSFNEKNLPAFLPLKATGLHTMIFNNKYFTRLRIYSLLRFLPFRLWLLLDKGLNRVFKKPSLFLVSITKNADPK